MTPDWNIKSVDEFWIVGSARILSIHFPPLEGRYFLKTPTNQEQNTKVEGALENDTADVAYLLATSSPVSEWPTRPETHARSIR
jgi:hypothetical protein